MPWWNPLKSLAKKFGLGKKEKNTEDEEREEPEKTGFLPHKGSSDRFSCKDDNCWCRRVGATGDPVIQLAGASMQMLEAAHNQSLGRHLKFDPEKTAGITIFLEKGWSEVKAKQEIFLAQIGSELQELLRSEGNHVEVFGCERWPYVDKETHEKHSYSKVFVNLHLLALEGRLHSAWKDPESALHSQADDFPLITLAHDIKSATPFTKTVITQLLEKGADINVFDRSGITPLHYAARQLNVEHVKLLLANKADPCIVDCHGNSPLHYAAMTATSWKPPPSEIVKGKGHKGKCSICGHVHVSNQCPLKVKIVAIVGKLKKSAKFKNNLDLTAQGTVMTQDKIDDIERVAKKNLEVVPNDECRVAIEASRQNAVRLQEMLAKLFVKK